MPARGRSRILARMYLPQQVELSGAVTVIPEGNAGIMLTLRAMRALVRQWRSDVRMRQTAINLLTLVPPKDSLGEVVALFEFVRDHIRYTGDVLDTETLTTPDKTLALRAGDCDDKSVLLATLLESVGFNTRFILAGYSTPDMFEHVYVSVMLSDGSLIALDPSEDRGAGFEPPNPIVYLMER